MTGAVLRDNFVSGVDEIVDIGGGQVRMTFYVNRMNDGKLERVTLSDALIMPMASVPDAVGKAMIAIGRKVIASEEGIRVAH